ncbi:Histidine kinase [Lentibacillus sp. JNUCC-1]|uniref:ATP-binding protein n=1 Tax=Lentibacillus sp. JNUCC-1 TaxID=2654513 RepID=UPI0012E6FE60|nr:ATP-binding protein [Lentibacillus sp. JNUCC-1]MUV39860.1 Histidine kinase [Lentibacillus sp. JNUCC-1]
MVPKSENSKDLSKPLPSYTLETLPQHILNWVDNYNHDVIVMFNDIGNIFYTSHSIQRQLGYAPTELNGFNWREIISPSDLAYINEHFLRHSLDAQAFNIRLRHKQGKWIWFEVVAAKHIINDEICYTVVLKDISDKKEAEELMIRSEKMSVAGQLAAGIAHEIRNPLTSLKGFVQLLQGGLIQKDAYYKIMLDEIDKMESITSELLFISKPLSNDFQIESLNDMVNDVMYLLRAQGKIRNISLNWEETEDHLINCNRSQIKQVLINLIKNAIEAMEQKGTIHIQTYKAEESVYIDIIDEGPGIPEEIIHKLTEPFFTTKESGTGLGLMITHQILQKHNGTLKVLSNEKKGSTFQIILPLN